VRHPGHVQGFNLVSVNLLLAQPEEFATEFLELALEILNSLNCALCVDHTRHKHYYIDDRGDPEETYVLSVNE
jgi:hypothetical protein